MRIRVAIITIQARSSIQRYNRFELDYSPVFAAKSAGAIMVLPAAASNVPNPIACSLSASSLDRYEVSRWGGNALGQFAEVSSPMAHDGTDRASLQILTPPISLALPPSSTATRACTTIPPTAGCAEQSSASHASRALDLNSDST